MRFNTKVHVRWDDLDAFNHVNNAKYLTFVQEARVDMFWVHPARQGLTPLAKGVVVARHEIDYLAPITWREEPILIEIWATKISASSFHLAYVLRDEATIFAKAKSVMVPYDLENQCPRRLDASERSALEPFLEEKP